MNTLDLLLIQTPNVKGTFFNLPGKEIPLSLCSLAAYLELEGYQCGILDLDFSPRPSFALKRALFDTRPKAVGISAYTPNIALASEIAGIVKDIDQAVPVVLGGFHASALPERTLNEFSVFDYLVVGEGERTICELLSCLSRQGDSSEVRGTVSRRGAGVHIAGPRPLIEDLDALPFPDRDLVPVAEYIPDPGNYFQLPSTGILYSRGCPYKCTFCSKSVFGHRIRYRSVENFLDEVTHCIEQHGIRDFRLEDEAPTVDVRRIRSLCEKILAKEVDITWNCFSRAERMEEGTLRLMKKAGCYHITYGIESTNPKTLERIKKKIDLGQAVSIIARTRRLGIECKANFILGFPWETVDDMKEVVRCAKRISPDLVTFNLFKPLPGSSLFDELKNSGLLRHTSWEDYFTTSEELLFEAAYTAPAAKRTLRWAVFSFYFRPRFVFQRLRRVFRHPRRESVTIGRGLGILIREFLKIGGRRVRPLDESCLPAGSGTSPGRSG